MNILFVCEGQSELIFIRNLIVKTLDLSKISFRCIRLRGNFEETVPYDYPNSNSSHNFTIINVENDERVLSVIRDRFELFQKKYDFIIGLRDMYSESYPMKYVDQKENNKIKLKIKKYIQDFDRPKKIRFFFMIMEFESWLLSLNISLSNFMENKTGKTIPVTIDNPEFIFRPSTKIKKLFQDNSLYYDKHIKDIEGILHYSSIDEFTKIRKNLSSKSFSLFLRYFYLLNYNVQIY